MSDLGNLDANGIGRYDDPHNTVGLSLAALLNKALKTVSDQFTVDRAAWAKNFTTYTPTVTGFTVGTGGAAASSFKYRREGKMIRVKFRLTLGTSGASVGSSPNFTLPVNAVTPVHLLQAYAGLGSAFDVSATNIAGVIMVAENSTVDKVRMYTIAATYAAGAITASLPWVWAAGDTIQGEFTYEAAS